MIHDEVGVIAIALFHNRLLVTVALATLGQMFRSIACEKNNSLKFPACIV